jgi:hypothetical protein
LPLLTGGPDVFAAVRKFKLGAEADAALRDLEALHALLAEAGVADRVLIDLGEVRRSDYYSGFMFKVYHQAVGEDLGGGGRYDRLFSIVSGWIFRPWVSASTSRVWPKQRRRTATPMVKPAASPRPREPRV